MIIGQRFGDPRQPEVILPALPTGDIRRGRLAAICAAIVILVGATAAQSRPAPGPAGEHRVAFDLPPVIGAWRLDPGDSGAAAAPQADLVRRGAYLRDGRRIEVSVAYLWNQNESRKVTGADQVVLPAGHWTSLDRQQVAVAPDGAPLNIQAIRLGDSSNLHRLLWSWYWVGGGVTANPLRARLLGVVGRLTGESRAAAIAVSTDDDGDPAAASTALANFLAAAPPLAEALREARLQTQ
jgi:EpsI family protein